MKENDYVQVKLDAWKTRIEVMEVEITGISDKTYCEVLTRLFNNQREHKQSILELINYYGNNRITLMINLSNYREHSYNSKEEDIEHIIDWVKSMCFYEDGIKVEYTLGNGYVWNIDEYRSKIEYFNDKEEYIYNFIRGEE